MLNRRPPRPAGTARLRRFNLDGVVTCCRACAARVRGVTSSVRSHWRWWR